VAAVVASGLLQVAGAVALDLPQAASLLRVAAIKFLLPVADSLLRVAHTARRLPVAALDPPVARTPWVARRVAAMEEPQAAMELLPVVAMALPLARWRRLASLVRALWVRLALAAAAVAAAAR